MSRYDELPFPKGITLADFCRTTAEYLATKPMSKIFPEAPGKVREGKCPFPGCDKNILGFRDILSLREFGISGMCQECQDDTFGKE